MMMMMTTMTGVAFAVALRRLVAVSLEKFLNLATVVFFILFKN